MKRLFIIVLYLILAVLLGIGIACADTAQRGLAMADTLHPEDRAALGVSWWYVWGWCDEATGCVPMVRSMELPPACPATLLVGNEPNALEPWGAPVTPYQAARKVRAIELQCPNTLLVVGNVSADDWASVCIEGRCGWGSGYNWLRQFRIQYRRYVGRNYSGALGVHCYQVIPGWCVNELARMRSLYSGEMWLTEYNDLSGGVANFTALTDYAFENFSRVALYTNRQPSAPWALAGASVVRDDGTLDDRGLYFSQR